MSIVAGLGTLLGAGARRADFLLQPLFPLTRELYDERPGGLAGSGAYTAEDWAHHRATLTGPPGPAEDRYASDASYLRYLESIHEMKIVSVLALLDAFDFSRYPRIIELGCGDMPQAHTIMARHPALAYTATDFDPVVIERCSRLPILAPISKAVLDATGALDALAGHDLVTSWSLEFALDDTQLESLFRACRSQGVPYLLCTHTAIGPLGWLARASGTRTTSRRRLGWLRSVGAIARHARRAGMTLRWKAHPGNHAALLFAPAR